jgi:UDP-N-acetylmuramyl tripeptide synthase
MAEITARDRLAVLAARLSAFVTRRAGYGGTSLPGLVARRVSPGVVGRLAAALGPITLVSGTNGKTTTALTLATILTTAVPVANEVPVEDEAPGAAPGAAPGTAPGSGRVLANPSGANLAQAIATTIVGAAGDLRGRPAVFEVDEAALPALLDELPVGLLVLTNLFRDQLDRFGETDRIIGPWRAALRRHPELPVVACVDDPRLAALVAGRPDVAGYGFAAQPALGTSRDSVTTDVTTCPVCAGQLVMAWTSIGHLGDYRCGSCSFARPEPTVAVRVVDDAGLDGQRLAFTLGQGMAGGRAKPAEVEAQVAHIGVANAYNSAAALAAAIRLGIPPGTAASGLERSRPAFARWERFEMEGRTVVLSLVKNPASLDEVTRAGSAASIDGVLFSMADQHADGRDTSWYWDVDPTALVPGRLVALAGPRAPDMLLRLRYDLCATADGVLPGLVGSYERPPDALDTLVARVPIGGSVLVVSTYTALLGLREELHRRGLVPAMPT